MQHVGIAPEERHYGDAGDALRARGLRLDRLAGCLESFSAFEVLSSQSPPAGGAPDFYGLGRGAAGPRGSTSAARAGRCRAGRTGLLRVATQDVTIYMSASGTE